MDSNLVPLQIVKYGQSDRESFGKFRNPSQNRKDLSMFYEQRKLLDEAKTHGYNSVGVVGEAGIGKSCLSHDLLKHLTEINSYDVGGGFLIFYVACRRVNFSQKTTAFQLLISDLLPKWKFNAELDSEMLEKLDNWYKLFIITDGLDEADDKLFFSSVKNTNLHDCACPDQILNNIFCGRLLPNAMKLVTSRPDAFLNLNSHCKPQFNVRILGLNKDSQQQLCQQICDGDHQLVSKVNNMLKSSPDLLQLCYVPLHCKLIVEYLRDTDDHGVYPNITLTSVFTETFCRFVRNVDHFRGDVKSLPKLLQLAFEGVKANEYNFHIDDFGEAEDKVFINFLLVQDAANLLPNEKILAGDKIFFFSHLLWQEHLAAIWLMFFTDQQEFDSLLKTIIFPRFVSVLQFSFGFQNISVKEKILATFPNARKGLFSSKIQSLNKVAKRRLKSNDFVQSCGWAFESKEHDLISIVRESLPSILELPSVIELKDAIGVSFVINYKNNGIGPLEKKSMQMTASTIFREGSLAILLDTVINKGHEVSLPK